MALSAIEQRVSDEIGKRRDALLSDLKRHVGLPTGGFNEDAIEETRALLTTRLVGLGATHRIVPAYPKPDWLIGSKAGAYAPATSVCSRLGTGDGGRVLICGHMDTVHDPKGSFRELSVAPDGKTAVGPGCVDMKGGLVIAVAALEALEACGVPARWTFLLNGDEETGTYHSERAIRVEAKGHDFGLALEPALPGGALAIERVGSGQFMIETRGRAAHAGREFTKGISAVTKLAECILAVAAMPEPERGRTFNIGPLRGGVATNAVPDSAAAWGNVRFPDARAADEMGAMLDALQTPADAMPGVVVRRSFNRPAKPLTAETEALALRARGVAEDLGQALPFEKTGGVCDGNIMQDAGLATIDTMGVRGGGLHTPDEWIELDSLVERCQLLAILIARLSAGGSAALS
ncbi:MAG: M20 family peptidase [Planctomycetota bacterium]|nr:MAG: M20 family peptidase [Planctomycetota bacterium]